MERLEIGDFLLAAQAVTGIDAHVLAKNPRTMEQAEAALAVPWAGFGEVEVYPTLEAKAAAYAAAIVRYHPLVDGNKRAAFATMLWFLAVNGRTWRRPSGATAESEAEMVKSLAAGTITPREWAAWVTERIV